MSTAGKNLKYLRKLRGWTQEEFAAKLHIKRSLLGAYEEERAEPRIEVLESVGEIFKLTLDELLLTELGDSKGNYLAKRRAQKLAAGSSEITFVPVKAAAGYLAGYSDPEYIDELNTFTLPKIGYQCGVEGKAFTDTVFYIHASAFQPFIFSTTCQGWCFTVTSAHIR